VEGHDGVLCSVKGTSMVEEKKVQSGRSHLKFFVALGTRPYNRSKPGVNRGRRSTVPSITAPPLQRPLIISSPFPFHSRSTSFMYYDKRSSGLSLVRCRLACYIISVSNLPRRKSAESAYIPREPFDEKMRWGGRCINSGYSSRLEHPHNRGPLL
jgi:hypothetical protein